MTLQIDGVLYLRILDPFKVCSEPEPEPGLMFAQPASSDPRHLFLQASYGVEDPEYAVTQLAQTTMRSELGKLTLDKVFRVTSASSPAGSETLLTSEGFRRKESRSMPTSSTPSTRRQTSGGSAASATRSKTYTSLLGSKSPCRCR